MTRDPARVGVGARPWLAWLVRLVITLTALTCGCKPGGGQPEAVVITVFAASSLTEAFEALERAYEQAHPGEDVQLSFAGSQVLRLQIEQGAPADVFASADERHMQALVDAGLVSQPQTFAQNELVVIVPVSDPAGVARFEALDAASRVVIGTDGVPVGAYARQVLERARGALGDDFADAVLRHVVSEESNARLVRAKVELGEADAAIVYRTDAIASTRARVVPIPDALNARASYPIGALTRSRHPVEAARFIAYVRSPAGRQTLARHGFIVEVE